MADSVVDFCCRLMCIWCEGAECRRACDNCIDGISSTNSSSKPRDITSVEQAERDLRSAKNAHETALYHLKLITEKLEKTEADVNDAQKRLDDAIVKEALIIDDYKRSKSDAIAGASKT